MNLSRHLIIVIALCMSTALGVGAVSYTSASVDATKSVVQFGSPRESYGVVPDAVVSSAEDRKTFISSVQSALRNRPEKVVEKVKEDTPPPAPEAVATVPALPTIESTSTPEVESSSTTTHEAQGEIIQPAL